MCQRKTIEKFTPLNGTSKNPSTNSTTEFYAAVCSCATHKYPNMVCRASTENRNQQYNKIKQQTHNHLNRWVNCRDAEKCTLACFALKYFFDGRKIFRPFCRNRQRSRDGNRHVTKTKAQNYIKLTSFLANESMINQ